LRNLDWVPILVDESLRATIDPQERQVVALIDGISSYGDIVASSSLGRLTTLRLLRRFVECGGIQPMPAEPSATSASATFSAPNVFGSPGTPRARVSGEHPRRSPTAQRSNSSPAAPAVEDSV